MHSGRVCGLVVALMTVQTAGDNDLIETAKKSFGAVVEQLTGQGATAINQAGQLPFDPCGNHGELVSRRKCLCKFSCAGTINRTASVTLAGARPFSH